MSKNKAENRYILVKDAHGNEVLCSLNPTGIPTADCIAKIGDYVEREVIRRYTGTKNKKPS